MNRKKNVIISIIGVLLLIIMVTIGTYAFIVAMTNEESVGTGSGMLDINYAEPGDITGTLSPSSDRSGGLFTSAKASLKDGSVDALFNMYITPTALTNLNISALKWEAEGIREGNVICSGSGDFSSASVGTPIKLFVNDITDNIDDCNLSTSETTFNIYIWLDVGLITTSLGGINFGATIGADSVNVTGRFDKLPSEYQRVEYIEATGTQYIEIDYIASNKTNSKGTYQIMNIDSAKMLFGSRTSGSENAYSFNWGGGSPYKYYNVYSNSLSDGLTKKQIDLYKHTFEKKGATLYIDGVELSTRTDVNNTFITPYKMIVFGCNTSGTKGLFVEARIFDLKFYDDDVLKVDLVPCYRKTDDVIGMYDIVNDKFYTNLGAGEFLKGNDV